MTTEPINSELIPTQNSAEPSHFEGELPRADRIQVLIEATRKFATIDSTTETVSRPQRISSDPKLLGELHESLRNAHHFASMFGVADISAVIIRLHREGCFPNLNISVPELSTVKYEVLSALLPEVAEACLGHIDTISLCRFGHRLASSGQRPTYAVNVEESPTLGIPTANGGIIPGYKARCDAPIHGGAVLPLGRSFVQIQPALQEPSAHWTRPQNYHRWLQARDFQTVERLEPGGRTWYTSGRNNIEISRLHRLQSFPAGVLCSSEPLTLNERYSKQQDEMILATVRPESIFLKVHLELRAEFGTQYSALILESLSNLMQAHLMDLSQRSHYAHNHKELKSMSLGAVPISGNAVVGVPCLSTNESEIRHLLRYGSIDEDQVSGETRELMAHTGAQLQKIEDDRNMTVADKQAQVFLLMKGLFGKNFRDTAEG